MCRAAFAALSKSPSPSIVNISATLQYGATWWQVRPDVHGRVQCRFPLYGQSTFAHTESNHALVACSGHTVLVAMEQQSFEGDTGRTYRCPPPPSKACMIRFHCPAHATSHCRTGLKLWYHDVHMSMCRPVVQACMKGEISCCLLPTPWSTTTRATSL